MQQTNNKIVTRIVWLHRTLVWLLVLTLFLSPAAPVAAQPISLRVHPALLQLAEAQPNEVVRVIVQRKAEAQLSPAVLTPTGGRVIKELPFIHGFIMELPARAVKALGQEPAVHWISLDAPMQSANTVDDFGEEGFSTAVDGVRHITDLALQPDRKIVSSAHWATWSNTFTLIRHNANGGLDPAFGVNGVVNTNISASYDYAQAVAVQSDGSLVVAGHSLFVR